ncbi:hypothetical protein LINPERPRIM_LOCUS3831, partial [Linum perenne]
MSFGDDFSSCILHCYGAFNSPLGGGSQTRWTSSVSLDVPNRKVFGKLKTFVSNRAHLKVLLLKVGYQ